MVLISIPFQISRSALLTNRKKIEVYFYCLEALPMFPCFVIFNIFHPSRLLDTVGKEDVVVEEGSGVGSMEEMKV